MSINGLAVSDLADYLESVLSFWTVPEDGEMIVE